MPLPTLEKTWQHAHVSNALNGSEVGDLTDIFVKIKNALKAFGSHPLTCVGSSNGTTANMSGTDLIPDPTGMTFGAGGVAHSWIVLAMDQIAPNAQICFNFREINRWDILVSVAGFTGGSITARPTATDEIYLLTNDSMTGKLGIGDGSGGQVHGHLMLSSDGQCLRVVIANNAVVGGFLLVEKPGGAVAGWTDPMIGWFVGTTIFGNTTESLTNTWWAAGYPVIRAWGPIALMPLYLSLESPGIGTYAVVQRLNLANELSGEYPVQRVGLWHQDTVGQRGRHGYIHDFWFTCQTLQNGDTMPADGSKQFIVFGDAVFPGDGTDWATG